MTDALTLNHLLFLIGQSSFSPGVFQEEDIYSVCRCKQLQVHAQPFWEKMNKEVPSTVLGMPNQNLAQMNS